MALMTVLLAEDDTLLAEGIETALRLAGLDVDHFSDGKRAFEAFVQRDYAAVILDLNLPSMDGMQILDAIRNKGSSVPVLVLTARDTIEDVVSGLNRGADDYLTKPFDLSELEARLKALLRRRPNEIENAIEIGKLRFDIFGRRATIDGKSVTLSARETELLEILLAHRGKVVNKDDVLDKLFGVDKGIGVNAVEVCMHRLRKKCSGAGVRFSTLRGLGYVLEAESA